MSKTNVRYLVMAIVLLTGGAVLTLGMQQTPNQVYENSVPAVVFIESFGTETGTGFIIQSDGCLLTAAHVIGTESQEDITVRFQDGHTQPAKLLAFDNKNDVAVLKVEGQDLPWVPIGDSDLVAITDQVITISYPKPSSLNPDTPTVSVGRVEALRERYELHTGFARTAILEDVLQISGTIRPGSSGGPVFNMNGEVIGVVSATPGTSELSNTAYISPINRAPMPSICIAGSKPAQGLIPILVPVLAIVILAGGGIGGWMIVRRRQINPIKLLRASDFFSALDTIELDQVHQACKLRSFESGEALVQEGDMDSPRMFVILKGQVEVRSHDRALGKRGVGRMIGELSLFTGEPRTADVIALKLTSCLELSRESLFDLLRQNPEIGVKMFDDMLFRLREAQEIVGT
jgi:hypothetical protein